METLGTHVSSRDSVFYFFPPTVFELPWVSLIDLCSHQIKGTAHRQHASEKIWQQQKFTNLICNCFSKTAQSTPSVLESDQLMLEEVTSSQAQAL